MIGDGRTARIWKDNWLGDNSVVCSRLPTNGLDEDAHVFELIDPNSRNWDRHKIT